MNIKIYEYNFWRVLKNAWLVYLSVSAHTLFNVLLLLIYFDSFIEQPSKLIYLLIANIPLLLISVPNLIIYQNYLKYTKKNILKITDEYIKIKINSKKTTIKFSDIKSVNIHETAKQGGTICGDWYSWYEVVDNNGETIKICSYLAPIDDLWEDFLSKKIDCKIVTHFPPLEGRGKWYSLWDFSFPLIK